MGVGVNTAIGIPVWLAAEVAAAILLAGACGGRGPLAARAASTEASECRDALPPEDEARALESIAVVGASSRFHQNACNGECRITAVQLVVRPPRGVTLERFAQMLRCHSLRVLDGDVDASRIPIDPYGLRDTWLEIDVSVADGNFIVKLMGDSISDTLRIQQRAMAYAGAHGVAWRWH
jgi:hypothetical protein